MRTIILIDQNKDNFQFMKEAFASFDDKISCLSFVFPAEAIDALLDGIIEEPHAIFMNFNISGRSAVKLVKDLRSNDKFDTLPIMLYTSKTTSDIVESVKDLGVTMTFEKPNTIREWKVVLRDILNSINNAPPTVHDNATGAILFG